MGSDTQTNVVELAQLLHNTVNLLGAVEHYGHLACRIEAESSGFSIPPPMAFDIRTADKSLFDAVATEDLQRDRGLPDPMSVRFSTIPTISSMNSSQPRQALGASGGFRSGVLNENIRRNGWDC